MFLCPLCGKQNSIKYYHPETFDDDVEIFHNASHGRGKPFEKILGFSLEEFPELNEKLGNRAQRVSEFLNPQPMTDTSINELKKQLEEEIKKRIIAEEHLEELDLEFLLNKVEGSLGWKYTDVHTAVDELITTNRSLTSSNRFIESMKQTLESSCIKLELEKRDIESDNNRLKNENIRLKENFQKWVETHRNLESSYSKLDQMKNKLESETARIKKENIELKNIIHQWAESQNSLKSQHRTQINEYSNALIRAQNRFKQAEDSMEELDLEILLEKIHLLVGHLVKW